MLTKSLYSVAYEKPLYKGHCTHVTRDSTVLFNLSMEEILP